MSNIVVPRMPHTMTEFYVGEKFTLRDFLAEVLLENLPQVSGIQKFKSDTSVFFTGDIAEKRFSFEVAVYGSNPECGPLAVRKSKKPLREAMIQALREAIEVDPEEAPDLAVRAWALLPRDHRVVRRGVPVDAGEEILNDILTELALPDGFKVRFICGPVIIESVPLELAES